MPNAVSLMPSRARAWVAARREARLRRGQLPLVASVLAAYVRAGRSLRQAVADAAAEVPDPSARALGNAAAAIALGAPPGEALGALGDDPDVTHLRAVIEMQARTGGDLALVLDRMAEVLRAREELRRAAAVATAQARATGRMVSVMPTFGLATLWLLDRPGFGLVVASPLGWAALLVSALLAGLGHVLIARIAAIEP
jgi:tight adherence protein B